MSILEMWAWAWALQPVLEGEASQFSYDAESGVVVCTTCGACLVPSAIEDLEEHDCG